MYELGFRISFLVTKETHIRAKETHIRTKETAYKRDPYACCTAYSICILCIQVSCSICIQVSAVSVSVFNSLLLQYLHSSLCSICNQVSYLQYLHSSLFTVSTFKSLLHKSRSLLYGNKSLLCGYMSLLYGYELLHCLHFYMQIRLFYSLSLLCYMSTSLFCTKRDLHP